MQHFPFPASREKGTLQWTPKVDDTKGCMTQGHPNWIIGSPQNQFFLLVVSSVTDYFPVHQWALLKNRRVDRQVERQVDRQVERQVGALLDDFALPDDFSLPDADDFSIL